MRVIPLDIPELGNRSYIIHDGSSAVVIDPSRRIQQIMDEAARAHARIEAVFETHIHNDYITGGYALARELGVPYYLSAHEPVAFAHRGLEPEQAVAVGSLKVTALASPGHTSHHLSYLVEQETNTPALFSGGSLLYGAVGRPDLISVEATPRLAREQYRTAHFFAKRLAPETMLYPTHGFGSFCAATGADAITASTLKQQLTRNHVFTARDEASFADELLAGLDVYPAYYARMAPANLDGPEHPQLAAPALLTKEAVLSALHTGAAVVDMRSRTAYAARHLAGTYNIEKSTDFMTYAGWLVAADTPLILIAATADDVAEAQEQLSLIGRELAGQQRPAEMLAPGSRVSAYAVKTFSDLSDELPRRDDILVIDVRRQSEWQKGHIPRALHIPLHELSSRLPEIAADKELWIYCNSGFRASIAASILSGGRRVVLINDSYLHALQAGLVPATREKFVDDIAAGNAQLLDVRDDIEWESGHAAGATFIPLGQLLDGEAAALEPDKPIYVYCTTGDRSGMAEDFLQEQGFAATNIGGLDDWLKAGGTMDA